MCSEGAPFELLGLNQITPIDRIDLDHTEGVVSPTIAMSRGGPPSVQRRRLHRAVGQQAGQSHLVAPTTTRHPRALSSSGSQFASCFSPGNNACGAIPPVRMLPSHAGASLIARKARPSGDRRARRTALIQGITRVFAVFRSPGFWCTASGSTPKVQGASRERRFSTKSRRRTQKAIQDGWSSVRYPSWLRAAASECVAGRPCLDPPIRPRRRDSPRAQSFAVDATPRRSQRNGQYANVPTEGVVHP